MIGCDGRGTLTGGGSSTEDAAERLLPNPGIPDRDDKPLIYSEAKRADGERESMAIVVRCGIRSSSRIDIVNVLKLLRDTEKKHKALVGTSVGWSVTGGRTLHKARSAQLDCLRLEFNVFDGDE